MSLRAAGIEAFGDDVALLELPEPPPLETGQVLIEVKAAGVGNWEEFVRTGGWDVGRVPPLALGVEAAGEVVGVGPEVEWPSAGAAVMTHPLPLPYQGCWAEGLIAPAHLVAEKPRNASWAEAAAFPVPALTAEQVVSEVLDVQPGETILVNGAGGVTGRGSIVELAANRGARVIATASESSAARVLALGADVVVDYHDPEWTSLARDAAGSSGIRAAANAAGGGEADALNTLVDRGRLATITGAPPPGNGAVRSRTSSSARTATSYACSPRLSRRGSLNVDIRATYPLTRAAEALAQAIKGSGSAIVLEP